MTPSPEFHVIELYGGALARGFWLYVWELTTKTGAKLYYVGRTGDSSSIHAQSPFNRMGQHLGHAKNSNMLRKHLGSPKRKLRAEDCTYRLVSFGPIFPETEERDEHRRRRDIVAALEKSLAEAMCAVGYEVLNTVHCRKPPQEDLFEGIYEAFAGHFKNLKKAVR